MKMKKIYTKVVLDMKTLETLEEEFFLYTGQIDLCGGPGAAGGGGGGTGTLDAQVKADYQELIGGGGTMNLATHMDEVLDTALGSDGNPYSGESAYNPMTELYEMQDRYDSFDEKISRLGHHIDWSSDIGVIRGALSMVGLDSADDLSETVKGIVMEALVDAFKVSISSFENAKSKGSELADKIVTDVDVLSNTVIDDARTDGSSYVSTDFDSGKTKAIDYMDSVDPYAKATAAGILNVAEAFGINTGKNSYDTLRALATTHASSDISDSKTAVETTVDNVMSNVFSKVVGSSSLIINAAVAEASNVVNNSVLSNVRTAFENRLKPSHYRNLARLTSSMATGGAINSTGYIFGIALLEKEYQTTLNDHDSKFEYELFNNVLTKYVEVFQNTVSQRVGIYVDHVSKYLASLRSIESSYLSKFSEAFTQYISIYLNNLNQYISTYGNTLPQYLGGIKDYTNLRAQVTQALTNVQSNSTALFNSTHLDTFKNLFTSHLGEQIRTNLHFDERKNQFFINNANMLANRQQGEIDAHLKSTQLQAEIDRIKVVALSEQYVQDLQIDVGFAKWDLEAFQYAGNVIGSLAGGVVSTPAAMTKSQSVLGGALAGASIGAEFGPWGALAGAAIGGAATGLLR